MLNPTLRIALGLAGITTLAAMVPARAATVSYVSGYVEHALEARTRLRPNSTDDDATNTVANFVDISNDIGASEVPGTGVVQVTHPVSPWLTTAPAGVTLNSTGQIDYQALGASANAVTAFTIDYAGSISASHDVGSSVYLLAEQRAGVGSGVINPEFLHTDLRFDVPAGGATYTFGGDFTVASLDGIVGTSIELLDENYIPIVTRTPVVGTDSRPDAIGTLAEGTYFLYFASNMGVDSRGMSAPSSNSLALDFTLSFNAVPEPAAIAGVLLIGAGSLQRRRTI